MSLFGQLIEGRPVNRVIIFEFEVPTHGLHELTRRDVLAQVFVELELLSGIGIDERCDQLEESPNNEGYYEEEEVSWANEDN
jgi:hypothetical protein